MPLSQPLLMLTLALTAVALNCSGGPEQYDLSAPAVHQSSSSLLQISKQVQQQVDWDSKSLEIMPSSDVEATDENLRRHNMNQDIVYGESVGGLDFEIELADALKKLNPKLGTYGTGEDVYPSGFGAAWYAQHPRRVRRFIIDISLGYTGDIVFPEPVGRIKFDSAENNFAAYFTEKDPLGAEFADQLYRGFHRNRGETLADSYSCIQENVCSAVISDNKAFHVLTFPGAKYLFTTDTKILFRVFITRIPPKSRLDHNHLDLVFGAFSPSGLRLGDSFAEYREKTELNQEDVKKIPSNSALTTITQEFGSDPSYLVSFVKSGFNFESKTILDSDRMSLINTRDGFNGNLLFSGKHLQIIASDKDNTVKLQPQDTRSTDQGGVFVDYKMNLAKEYSESFMQEFNSFMLGEMAKAERQKENESILSFSSISGLNRVGQGKEYLAEIMSYSPSRKTGHWVEVGLRPDLGRLFAANTQLLIDPAYQIIAPGITEKVQFNTEWIKANGFYLGEEVLLTDIHKGRAEATATFTHQDQKITTRSTFIEPVSLDAWYPSPDGSTEEVLEATLIEVGDVGPRIKLVVIPMEKTIDKKGNTVIRARILSIISKYFGQPISLCGQEIIPKMPYLKLMEALQAMTQSGNEHCIPRKKKLETGSQKFQTLTFPHYKVRLELDAFEIVQIWFYEHPARIAGLDQQERNAKLSSTLNQSLKFLTESLLYADGLSPEEKENSPELQTLVKKSLQDLFEASAGFSLETLKLSDEVLTDFVTKTLGTIANESSSPGLEAFTRDQLKSHFSQICTDALLDSVEAMKNHVTHQGASS